MKKDGKVKQELTSSTDTQKPRTLTGPVKYADRNSDTSKSLKKILENVGGSKEQCKIIVLFPEQN